MKKIFCLLCTIVFSYLYSYNGGQVSFSSYEDWFDHWLNGIAYFEEGSYENAICELTRAINLLESDRATNEKYIDLHNDRAQAYQCSKQFTKAISDYTTALTSENISSAQTIRALWGRTICYAALDESENFKLDLQQLQAIDPDYPAVQYTEEYAIFRNFHACSLNADIKRKFCCAMIHFDICESKKDILFTNTDVCLVKRRCQCGCERALKEQAYKRKYGKLCDCCEKIIRIPETQLETSQTGDYAYWRDRTLLDAFAICSKTWRPFTDKILFTSIIEALKQEGQWDCNGEDCYQKNLQLLEDFFAEIYKNNN